MELLGTVAAVILGTPIGIYSSIYLWRRTNHWLEESLRAEINDRRHPQGLASGSPGGTPVSVPVRVPATTENHQFEE